MRRSIALFAASVIALIVFSEAVNWRYVPEKWEFVFVAIAIAGTAWITSNIVRPRITAKLNDAKLALSTTESRLAGIISIAPQAIISIDENHCIQTFNKSAEGIFGYSADEIFGKPVEMLLPARFRDNHRKHVDTFAAAPERSRVMNGRAEILGLRKDGAEISGEASIAKLEQGDGTILIVIMHDMTDHKAAKVELAEYGEEMRHKYMELWDSKKRVEEQAITYVNLAEELALARDEAEENEQRYRELADNSPIGVWQITPEGQTVYANNPVAILFEVDSPQELFNKSFKTSFVPESREIFKQELSNWLLGGKSTCNVQIVGSRTGKRRDAEISGGPLLSSDSEVVGARATVIDITERKQFEDTIWKIAHNDPLTGLPNRQYFHDRLNEAIENAQRLDRIVGLMFLDLDDFKGINDNYGHPVGDSLLREVAERLSKLVRKVDTVARLGGDEFAIILTNLVDTTFVDKLANRVIEKIQSPFIADGCSLTIRTSIGICFSPLDDTDPDELMRKGDLALYEAKKDGRGCYRIFDNALHTKVKEQVALENDLRLALARDEFVLHYQPQLSTSTGLVVGAEALIRWQHPGRGLIPPGDFIPVAETSGLVVPMGEWVLHTACAQAKAWQDAGLPPFRMAVNISGRQIQGDGLVLEVESALKQSGLDPQWLELEITESMVIEDVDRVIEKLHQLDELGVTISLDDFGTGYSSLVYLKRFPLRRLKIDQSFVKNLTTDPEDEAITSAAIKLGHALNLKVVAEGVETKDQFMYLSAKGCDEVQGYYIGRPQPAEKFMEWATIQANMPPVLARPTLKSAETDNHISSEQNCTGSGSHSA